MIETVILIVLAFVTGWKFCETVMTMSFRQILRDLEVPEDRLRRLAKEKGIDLTDPPEIQTKPKDTIELRIEQHGNQLYAYRTDTEEFLGQGTDRDSLVERISRDFKNQRFTVRADQGADLLKS
jgi:hypothetical protein